MIHEVIVTTVDDEGSVHIAPMGIRYQDSLVVIAPFKPSQTLSNLLSTHCAVVNFTDDVRVFAGCLTGRTDWPTVPATTVPGRILECALAFRELQVCKMEDDALRPKVFLQETKSKTMAPFAGFNRAQAAVIEAAILISRLSMLSETKIDSELEYLSIAIDKTAGQRELIAWEWLLDEVSKFRDNKSQSQT